MRQDYEDVADKEDIYDEKQILVDENPVTAFYICIKTSEQDASMKVENAIINSFRERSAKLLGTSMAEFQSEKFVRFRSCLLHWCDSSNTDSLGGTFKYVDVYLDGMKVTAFMDPFQRDCIFIKGVWLNSIICRR